MTVSVNIYAGETDAEGRKLATTQQMSFCDVQRGDRGLSKPPIDNIDDYWMLVEKARTMANCRPHHRRLASNGAGLALDALVAETRADELMILSDVYDHADRRRLDPADRDAACRPAAENDFGPVLARSPSQDASDAEQVPTLRRITFGSALNPEPVPDRDDTLVDEHAEFGSSNVPARLCLADESLCA